MLASQLFWRIFAVYAALTVLSTLMFAAILSVRHQADLDRQLQQRLKDDALIFRDLSDGPPESGKLPLHATWLPLAEASKSTDAEVRQALRDGEGFAKRLPLMFYALRVGPQESPQGVLRVSLPRLETTNGVAVLDLSFWAAALLMIGLGLVLTYRVVSRIIGPLETLTAAARQIAAGEKPREVPIRSRNEIGTLAQALDSMNRQLASRIADLQQQGRQLEHNNEQLATVLGAMVEGVIAVDDREQVILANNAVFRLLEMSPTAMVGRPLWEAVRHPRIEELVRRALRGEACERLEFQMARSQSTISVAVSQLPGKPCPGAVLVLHDVTELRRLERLRREFVANVSHELKTPLTSIAAYTETLLDGAMDDPEHNREFLQRIEEQTERLQVLIVDLLSLANMEAEESVLELTPVDAAKVIEASVDAHQAVAEAKRIQLTVAGEQDEADVLAEAEGVRIVMDNLLDNAINYTPMGGCVTVRWSAAGEWFQIDVTDTGVGIAREHQARIFERFFRVDRARSREVGGTGLGLSIVKHWCQMFGGSVSVVSQVGQGSTFTVRLKRALSNALT